MGESCILQLHTNDGAPINIPHWTNDRGQRAQKDYSTWQSGAIQALFGCPETQLLPLKPNDLPSRASYGVVKTRCEPSQRTEVQIPTLYGIP